MTIESRSAELTGQGAHSAGAGLRARREGPSLLNAVYAATFTVVVFLVATPIAALVFGSFRTAAPGLPAEWTLANYAGLASRGVLGSMLTTLSIGLISSAACIVIGTAITLVVYRTDFKYKNVLTALLGLSFYFPSFILAMAWIIIGSPGGMFNGLMDLLGLHRFKMDIYSAAGIVYVMVLHQVPFVFLTLRGPVTGMDSIYEEAARSSGARPSQVLLRVTLPLLAYSIVSSFILTFILTIEQFAVPALLGIPGQVTVLATQLYLLVRFSPTDYGLAAAVGLALSAMTALAIMAQRRVTGAARLTTITGKSGRLGLVPLGAWTWPAYALCFGFVFLSLIMPMLILLYTSVLKWFAANPFNGIYTFRNYSYIWYSGTTLRSFWNALIVCGIGALVGVVLGLASSYFTVRQRPRGSRILDFATILPFGVPGIVLGLGLLWAYAYLPLPLYGTLAVIIVAFVTRFLPYATETIGGQLVQIDRSLEEAAWVGGATRLESVRRVLIPLVMPSLQGAYFLLFMAFFREISSAVLLYSANTQIVSISIWTFFEQANWGLASALSVVATLVIFAVMSLVVRLFPVASRA